MKKLFTILMVILIAAALTCCGGGEAEEQTGGGGDGNERVTGQMGFVAGFRRAGRRRRCQ